jgi:hypothetical protein
MLKLNDKTQLLPTDIKVYPASYFSEMKLNDQSIFLHDHQLSWTTPMKAKIMKPSLILVKKIQPALEYPLSLATKIQFQKHKKVIKKVNKQRLNE